jgi:hypothetical protein
MTGWAEALDTFEERLRSYRRVLERGNAPEIHAWPPDDLTDADIPRALVPRAQALLAEAVELEAELSAARAAVQVPLSHARRRRPAPSRPSISTDL